MREVRSIGGLPDFAFEALDFVGGFLEVGELVGVVFHADDGAECVEGVFGVLSFIDDLLGEFWVLSELLGAEVFAAFIAGTGEDAGVDFECYGELGLGERPDAEAGFSEAMEDGDAAEGAGPDGSCAGDLEGRFGLSVWRKPCHAGAR